MITFLGMLVVAVAVAIVGWPLLRRPGETAPSAAAEDYLISDLLFQREATYAAISELDADHAMGNLSDSDHHELRQRYEEKALSILKAIDDLGRGDGRDGGPLVTEDLLSQEIEEQVLALRRKKPARRKRTATATCHNCGGAVASDANFCSHCGARLILVCSGCGAQREPDDLFCTRCGMALEPING